MGSQVYLRLPVFASKDMFEDTCKGWAGITHHVIIWAGLATALASLILEEDYSILQVPVIFNYSCKYSFNNFFT